VDPSRYPRFTLFGQGFGSIILGWEAFGKLIPDVFIDTCGYAFTYPLAKYLGDCKVVAYVHYPSIRSDMLSLENFFLQASYSDGGFLSRSALLALVKIPYYLVFAAFYALMGASTDLVMVNSSWTKEHIQRLWGRMGVKPRLVFPPCDVTSLSAFPLSSRMPWILSLAQFRPEKDHALQLKAFQLFKQQHNVSHIEHEEIKLILVGGVRNQADKDRVEALKTYAKDLGLQDAVEFVVNASIEDVKKYLSAASVGLHTMYMEHFGISVVECMAAGLLMIAHDSGGPRMDIVASYKGQPMGFLANDEQSFALSMEKAFDVLQTEEGMRMRQQARLSMRRFSEEAFEKAWMQCLGDIV